MENEGKNPSRSGFARGTENTTEDILAILRTLLVADDVIELKALKGEYSPEEASRLAHAIAVTVDGMALTALTDEELAEGMVSVINEHMKNSRGNPRPYHHLLHLLAYAHRLEVDGVTHDPSELFESYAWVKSEMDLDIIEEQRTELEEELGDQMDQLKLEKDGRKNNQMFA